MDLKQLNEENSIPQLANILILDDMTQLWPGTKLIHSVWRGQQMDSSGFRIQFLTGRRSAQILCKMFLHASGARERWLASYLGDQLQTKLSRGSTNEATAAWPGGIRSCGCHETKYQLSQQSGITAQQIIILQRCLSYTQEHLTCGRIVPATKFFAAGCSLPDFSALCMGPSSLLLKYQRSGEGGTRSPPATPAKSKMAARGPQNGRRGLP